MMHRATVRRGFIQLRELCDPRGHELLDAIEETLVDSLEAVERLDAMFQTLTVVRASVPDVVSTGGPGVRVVNGEAAYSSEWLNDDAAVNP